MEKIYFCILMILLPITLYSQTESLPLLLDFDSFPDLEVEAVNPDKNLNPFLLFTVRDLRQFAFGFPTYATGLIVADIKYPKYPLLFLHLENIPGCGPSCAQLSDARIYETPAGPNLMIHKEVGHLDEYGTPVRDYHGFIFYDENLEPVDSIAPPQLDFHDVAIHPISGNKIHAEIYADSLLFPSELTGFPNDSIFSVEAIKIIETDTSGNVVFSWISSQELAPDDMLWNVLNPPGPLIDWDHWNSVRYDSDDNLLLSFRHVGLVKVFRPDAAYPEGRYLIFSGKNSHFNLPPAHQTLLQHDFYYFPEDGLYYCFSNGLMTSNDPEIKEPATGFVYDINWQDTSYALVQKFNPSVDSLVSFGGGNWHRNADGSHLFNLGGFINFPEGNPLAAQPAAFYVDANDVVRYQFYFDEGGIFSYQFHSFDTTLLNIQRPEILCDATEGGLVLSTSKLYPQYLWSNGDTTATITVQDTGYYFVNVALNAYFASSALPVHIGPEVVCFSTNVSHQKPVDSSIKIYPNPSDGVFSLSSNIKQNINITIINSTGLKVFEKKNLVLSDAGYNINLQSGNSGVYFVRIRDFQTGILWQEKVLLMR